MQGFWKALAAALAAQWLLASAVYATVNINTASKEELVALPGIGPVKAQAILDHRKASGPFKSVDDLKGVKGIGAKRLEKLRGEVTVSGDTAKVAAAPSGKPAESKAGGAGTAKGEIRPATDAKVHK
jgi:competence protein ComEA